MKNQFNEYYNLFKSDENFSFSPFENYIFQFKGNSNEAIKAIKSIKNLSFFTKRGNESISLVNLNKIIWTDHPSYQEYWDIDLQKFRPTHFVGKREPPEEGVFQSWSLRQDSNDKFIALKKHPDLDLYCISEDGNNRVMKSLTTPNRPDDIYAKVSYTIWNNSALLLLNLFEQINFFYVEIFISKKITIGFKEFKDSKIFYHTLDTDESPSYCDTVKAFEIKRLISNWHSLSLWNKTRLAYRLLVESFKS